MSQGGTGRGVARAGGEARIYAACVIFVPDKWLARERKEEFREIGENGLEWWPRVWAVWLERDDRR